MVNGLAGFGPPLFRRCDSTNRKGELMSKKEKPTAAEKLAEIMAQILAAPTKK